MLKSWILTLRTTSVALLAGTVAAVNGCDGWVPHEQELATKVVRVAAMREPLSRVRPGEGLEHDLLWQFTEHFGSRLQWKWYDTPEDVLQALKLGKADVGAGRWSLESLEVQNLKGFAGPAYEESPGVLVCRRDMKSEQEASFLGSWFKKNEGRVIEEQPLKISLHRRDAFPRLIRELESTGTDWKISLGTQSASVNAVQVQNKKIDCFVTDATTARFVVSTRPALRVVRQIGTRFSRVLLFAPHQQDTEVAFTGWFQKHNRLGQISRIRHRYLGYQDSLTDQDRNRLLRASLTQLSELKPKFKKYAAEFDLPWELIAAVAYQESHWNHEARSHTGVRGFMQLTQETARHLGVEDREDLEQSLWGGAKYLRSLINRQPSHLHFRERLALALASYNVGPAHLKDAQKLAVEAGRSPFSFWELRLFLPLLSDPAIAADLEYGLARGEEPVHFTERVLAYYDLLSR